MPRGDRTGPMGMGSMTGRAAGHCAGYNLPEHVNPIPRRVRMGAGQAQMRGGCRGWRYRKEMIGGIPGQMRYGRSNMVPFATTSPDDEKRFLQEQADALQNQLSEIRKRLDELD